MKFTKYSTFNKVFIRAINVLKKFLFDLQNSLLYSNLYFSFFSFEYNCLISKTNEFTDSLKSFLEPLFILKLFSKYLFIDSGEFVSELLNIRINDA